MKTLHYDYEETAVQEQMWFPVVRMFLPLSWWNLSCGAQEELCQHKYLTPIRKSLLISLNVFVTLQETVVFFRLALYLLSEVWRCWASSRSFPSAHLEERTKAPSKCLGFTVVSVKWPSSALVCRGSLEVCYICSTERTRREGPVIANGAIGNLSIIYGSTGSCKMVFLGLQDFWGSFFTVLALIHPLLSAVHVKETGESRFQP